MSYLTHSNISRELAATRDAATFNFNLTRSALPLNRAFQQHKPIVTELGNGGHPQGTFFVCHYKVPSNLVQTSAIGAADEPFVDYRYAFFTYGPFLPLFFPFWEADKAARHSGRLLCALLASQGGRNSCACFL